MTDPVFDISRLSERGFNIRWRDLVDELRKAGLDDLPRFAGNVSRAVEQITGYEFDHQAEITFNHAWAFLADIDRHLTTSQWRLAVAAFVLVDEPARALRMLMADNLYWGRVHE